ncbi:MAG: GatB/YqeY domain-containing protein [Salibacteraceae bacterium]
MSLADTINADIKKAMLAKEKGKLEALRAVKSALLLAATEKGADGKVDETAEINVLRKLVKQRKEAAGIYREQGRADLAEPEEMQAGVIEAYLPQQMGEDEVREVLAGVIAQVGAAGPQDMGKVMGAAMKSLNGKADGKLISSLVKSMLSGN